MLQRINNLHLLQSRLALPEHLDVFERGVASRLGFSFSGPQAARLAKLVSAGKINIGAIHTYRELFARYFVDLTPRAALIVAEAADRYGNQPGMATTGTATTGTATFTPAQTRRARLRLLKQPHSKVESVSSKLIGFSTRFRASIPLATGLITSYWRRNRLILSHCLPAIRRRSLKFRCRWR